MPRFGICTKVEEAGVVKGAGWDYMEESVQGLLKGLEDEVVWDGERRARGAAVPVEAANMLVPGALKVTGPNVVFEGLRGYMSRVTERAGRLGIKTLVFGSAGARNVPEGLDRGRAEGQIVEFLKMVGPMAERRGVTIVIEPLNRGESNIINSVGEAVAIAERVGHPAVKCLVDSYHFWLERESLEELRGYMGWVRHVHVADVEGRVPPGESGGGDDYVGFFRVIRGAGYEGGISVETGQGWDIGGRGEAVLEYVKRAWREA